MDYGIHFEDAFDESIKKFTLSERRVIFNKINLLKNNIDHPSLRTEKLYKGTNIEIRSSSVSMGIRLIWQLEGNIIHINDVGRHDIYRKYNKRKKGKGQ